MSFDYIPDKPNREFNATYMITQVLGGACNFKVPENKLRANLLRLYNMVPTSEMKTIIDDFLKGKEITDDDKKTILNYTKPLVEQRIGTSPVKYTLA